MPKPSNDLSLEDLTGLRSVDEFGPMPTQEKVERTLAREPGTPPSKARGELTLGKVNAITKARMRAGFANLLTAEMVHIQEALAELRKENPKVYIDQMVQLAQFALPQLKAVEVDQGGTGSESQQAQRMTLSELQQALMMPPDEDVVSVQ